MSYSAMSDACAWLVPVDVCARLVPYDTSEGVHRRVNADPTANILTVKSAYAGNNRIYGRADRGFWT